MGRNLTMQILNENIFNKVNRKCIVTCSIKPKFCYFSKCLFDKRMLLGMKKSNVPKEFRALKENINRGIHLTIIGYWKNSLSWP